MDHDDGEFARQLLASLRSGLVAVDAEGRVRSVNDAARRILGLPQREGAADPVLGRPCRDVFAARPALAELLLGAASGGEPPSRAELRLDAGAGAPAATLGFTVHAIRAADGSLRGAAFFFRDLLPLERLDERERLREQLVALGEMAAGLAHEIRNPLASLGVTAGLLKRRLAGDPDARELVQEVLAEIHSVESTVTAALDFVKPVHPASSPVDLVESLEEALAQVRARVGFEGSLERDYPRDSPAVKGDPELLRGVFANLLSNALEAMDGQGRRAALRLAVSTRAVSEPGSVLRVRGSGPVPPTEARHEAVVTVADTGPGVAEALRDRIFYPFFTTKDTGSGVGLAVAQKTVAGYGGSLEVDGGAGAGATFRVRLPACKASG